MILIFVLLVELLCGSRIGIGRRSCWVKGALVKLLRQRMTKIATKQPQIKKIFSEPTLEYFTFETAKIKIGNKILFGTKTVVEKSTRQAKSFLEDLGNGVKLEMVAIPGRSFLMGSPDTPHPVNVPSLWESIQ
jgi:formylglycine-generating enzyme required for sulfatase activity